MRNWRLKYCCNKIVHRWCMFEFIMRTQGDLKCALCRQPLIENNNERTYEHQPEIEEVLYGQQEVPEGQY